MLLPVGLARARVLLLWFGVIVACVVCCVGVAFVLVLCLRWCCFCCACLCCVVLACGVALARVVLFCFGVGSRVWLCVLVLMLCWWCVRVCVGFDVLACFVCCCRLSLLLLVCYWFVLAW